MLRYSLPLILALAASEAQACIQPPPPIPLPGETDDHYRHRSKASAVASEAEDKRTFQASLYDKADVVILAMVDRSEPVQLDGVVGKAVEASTKMVLRGADGPANVRLANRYMTTCGFAGGGSATEAAVGEYILALRGPFFGRGETEWFGLRLSDLTEARLLDAVDDAALTLRDRSQELRRDK